MVKRTIQRLVLVALAVVLIGAGQQAMAQYRVAQESGVFTGDFDSNVLGTITPYSTPLSIVDFYNYNPVDVSFLGSTPSLTSDTSHLFLVDSAVDGLAMFWVFDAVNDGSGGLAVTRTFIHNNDSPPSILVADDPIAGDWLQSGAERFEGTPDWQPCCTDGVALGELGGNWEALMHFRDTPVGINAWQALSSGGGAPLSLDMSTGRRVQLTYVPEPTTMALMGAAGWLILGRRRRHVA